MSSPDAGFSAGGPCENPLGGGHDRDAETAQHLGDLALSAVHPSPGPADALETAPGLCGLWRLGKLAFNLEVRFDQSPSGTSDDLTKGVDVREIYRRIREVVKGPSRNLVETVAQDIADSLLAIDLVESVLVRRKKPAAYKYDAEEPGYEVEIERADAGEADNPGAREADNPGAGEADHPTAEEGRG